MKISLTGIAGGGKTVFLTALLWHLMEIDSGQLFPVREGFCHFREGPVRGKGCAPFPLDRHRDALARRGIWPEKTVDCHRYSCEIDRGGSPSLLGRLRRGLALSRRKLDFFDFPGERIADGAIASFDDYGHWSDHMLDHFRSHSDYAEALAPYFRLLQELESGDGGPEPLERIALTYRETLARLIHGYRPLIAPSIFLLDEKGGRAPKVSVDELARTRLCGLEGAPFAPLPPSVRARLSGAEAMAAHYGAYRAEMILPLFREIGTSEALIVLVDIPSILAGGVGRYNDNRQIILDLFDVLRPDSSLGARIWRLLTLGRGSLKKVAFVASKADLVDPEDIASGRLESLLRQMTSRARAMLPEARFGWFAASAVRSTRCGGAPGRLIGRLAYGNPERLEKEFDVPPLPETWPDDWQAGTYPFQAVYPDVPRNLQNPPPHLGLDRIIRFLLS